MNSDLLHTVEFVGLPGVGKTHVLRTGEFGSTPGILPGQVSAEKFKNISVGVARTRRLLLLALADLGSERRLDLFRSWPIIFERVGRRSASEDTLDEGLVQAIWGLVHAREPTEKNQKLCSALISRLPKSDVVVFIAADSRSHSRFIDTRDRRHPATSSSENEQLARYWMSRVLWNLRQSKETRVVRHRNRLAGASSNAAPVNHRPILGEAIHET